LRPNVWANEKTYALIDHHDDQPLHLPYSRMTV